MRKLKRSLAVALVLVMALGMMPFGSALTTSKDYTDAASITNKEAVDVLSAIKVMEGIDGDSGRHFSPGREVNRAEAAAIIARLMLGRNVADSLSTSATIFRDVPASHWASGYINWCVSKDIVQGYGDGRFGPRNNVKASEFAVMLLRALGWGRQGEYTGSLWETNAIVDAMSQGIFSGTGINFSGAANREQTALYAFNALGLEFMVWSRDTESYIEADRDSTKANNIMTSTYNNPKLEALSGQPDNFMRRSKVWKLGDETIGSYVSKANLTFNTAVTERMVYRGLGLRGVSDDTWLYSDGIMDTLWDGIAIIDDADKTIPGTGRGVQTEVFRYFDSSIAPAGQWVIDIIVINTWLAFVDDVTDAKDDNPRTLDLEIYATPTGLITNPVEYVTNSFDEDDVLLVTYSRWKGTVESAKLAPVVEDVKISSFTGTSNVAFGGTTYNYARNAVYGVGGNIGGSPSINTGFSFTDSYNFYLDDHNNIMGNVVYTPGVSPLNFAYVKDWNIKEGNAVGGLGAQAFVAKVELLFLDGKTEVFDLDVKTAGSTSPGSWVGGGAITSGARYFNFPTSGPVDQFYWFGSTDTNIVAGASEATQMAALFATTANRLVSYVVEDGKITSMSRVNEFTISGRTTTATIYDSLNTASFTFVRNAPSVGITTAFANNNSTLVTFKDGTATTFEGFRNFPAGTDGSHASTDVAPVIIVRTGSTLNNALVIGKSFDAAVVPDAFAVYTGNSRTVGTDTYEYELFVNGESKYYRLATGVTAPTTVKQIFTFAYNEETARATLGALTTANVVADVPVVRVDDSGFLVHSGTSLSRLFADDIKVFNVSGTNTAGTAASGWATTTTAGIRGGATPDRVTIVSDGDVASSRVIAIFIITRP